MQKYTIKVATPQDESKVKVTKDSSEYYSKLSKEWAVSNAMVENEDFSSKYYAAQAKKNIQDAAAELQEEMQTQVNIATQKAQIATEKAAELTSANKANADFSNITEAAENIILELSDHSEDVARIDSDLATKANLDLSNCTQPYVCETYSNGCSWYRVWSNGWIEQGGISAANTSGYVTFQKPFTSVDYCAVATKTTSAMNDYAYINVVEKQLVKLRLVGAWSNGYGASYSAYWYACGF